MGFNPFKAAEKKAKDAVNSVVRRVLNPAIDKAEDVGRAVERTAKAATAKAEEKIDDAQDAAVGAVRKAGREVEAGMKHVEDDFEQKLPMLLAEELPDALTLLANELASAAIKPGLTLAAQGVRAWHGAMARLAERKPDLVDAINELGFEVTVKVNVGLKLNYARFYTRAAEVAGILDRYAHDGIEPRRRDILGFVRATGPTSVGVPSSVAVSLGVDAGVEAGPADIPLALFLELADIALEELGVPE